jgi:hypothetical protein
MAKSKEILFETPIRNCKPLYSPEDKKAVNDFIKQFDGETLEWCLRSPEEIRRLKANRYYWGGVLSEFVPKVFTSTHEAHEYFTNKHLSHVDVLDLREDNFETVLNEIVRKSSRSRRTVKYERIDLDTVRITWVESTAILSKRDFKKYVDLVILEGQVEFGLEFEPIEKFNEHK